MLRLNKKHLNDLLSHVHGIIKVVSDAGHVPDTLPDDPESEIPATGIGPDSVDEVFRTEEKPAGAKPRLSAYSVYGNGEDSIRREKAIGRLCGRWTANKDYYDVEISQRGEHFFIRYLEDNGTPTGDRFILLWCDGDIYYYNPKRRITFLALNAETDTLMFSPGVDYIRVVESES